MKKFLPFLMILALLLSLTACGTAQSGSEPESTAQSPEESSAQTASEAPGSRITAGSSIPRRTIRWIRRCSRPCIRHCPAAASIRW